MSDQTESLDILDNLDIDVANVDTSRPCLPKGLYPFEIKDVQILPSKAKPGNRNLRVDFSLSDPAEALSGVMINPGYVVSKYYPLQQSDNPKAPDFKVDIAKLLEAALGEKQPLSAQAARELIGRKVILSLKVTNSEEYGASNEVSAVKPY